jgi:hypothetical protein
MAGQIIISNIKTDSDNAFSILANTGAVLFSANLASGITTGIADGSVTNAKLAGSITGDKITVGTLAGNVFTANTITGDKIGQNSISSNNIVSVNASVATVGTLPFTALPAGSVLQVVSAIKTDVSTTTSASWADISGLSVSITPKSATSKILVLLNVTGGNSNGGGAVKLVRGSTDIAISTAATGNRLNTTFASFYDNTDANSMRGHGVTFLDSPSTTSSTTYKAQFRMGITGGGYLFNVNAPNGNDDAAYNMRTVSTITVMEIAQ